MVEDASGEQSAELPGPGPDGPAGREGLEHPVSGPEDVPRPGRPAWLIALSDFLTEEETRHVYGEAVYRLGMTGFDPGLEGPVLVSACIDAAWWLYPQAAMQFALTQLELMRIREERGL